MTLYINIVLELGQRHQRDNFKLLLYLDFYVTRTLLFYTCTEPQSRSDNTRRTNIKLMERFDHL